MNGVAVVWVMAVECDLVGEGGVSLHGKEQSAILEAFFFPELLLLL